MNTRSPPDLNSHFTGIFNENGVKGDETIIKVTEK